MPSTYFQMNTTAGVMADNTVPAGTLDTVWSKRDYSLTAGTSASLVPTIAVSATECGIGDTPALGADAANVTGTQSYTVTFTIASGTIANLFANIRIARFNSGGTLQTGVTTTEVATATTGLKTFTFNADLGTFASTDRLRVYYIWRNSSTMNIQNPSITVNTSASTLTVPWPADVEPLTTIVPNLYSYI